MWNTLPNRVYACVLMSVGVVTLKLLASYLRDKFPIFPHISGETG